MDNAASPEITDEMVNDWATHISAKIALFSRHREGNAAFREHLLKLSPATLKWVMAAVVRSNSAQLLSVFSTLVPMGFTEQSLLCHARYWETYEYGVTTNVHRSSIFQHLDDAPLLGTPDEMLPYVAKAHALMAVSDAFHLKAGTAKDVEEIDQKHSEYVDFFINNRERALELVLVMQSGKTSIDDLKYHLSLHPAMIGGEL